MRAKKKNQIWQKLSKRFKRKPAPVSTNYTKGGSIADSRKVFMVPISGLLLVVGLFVLLGGPAWVKNQLAGFSFFKVRNIEYAGSKIVSEEEIRQLSGITLYQTSLLGLDQARVIADIRRHPWINQVSVTRNWPTDITITVKEYSPIALMNVVDGNGPRLFYVDRYGTPFMEISASDDVDFPVITGLDRVTDEQEKKAIFNDVYTFIRAVSQNNPTLPAQSVSEIHINEKGELVIYLVDYTFPIFFGRGEIRQKYSRLVRVLDSLYRGRGSSVLLSGVEYIRMDYYNGKVLVAQSESS